MATNKNSSELPWKRLASTWPCLTGELEIAQAARSLAGEVASVQRFRVKLDPAAPWPANIAPDHRWPAITLGFLSWASDCFDSVVLLMSAGLHVHARVLSRSLLEGLMHLLHISDKPDERAQSFLSHYWAEQKNFLDHVAKIPGLRVDQSRLDGVNANYERYCCERVTKSGRPKTSWHGGKTADLFREVSKTTPGLEGWYETIYSPASDLAHASTSAFVQYLSPSPKTGTLRLGAQPSERHARLLLKLGAFALLGIAGIANRALGLGLDQRLSELAKALEALERRALASLRG